MAEQSSVSFDDPRSTKYYFNNDYGENPRSDGGYITIAVQVIEPDFNDERSEGSITIWHLKTNIPEKGTGKDPPLPQPKGGPTFAGELKMDFKNAPIISQQFPGGKPPSAATHVPFISLRYAYQGLRIAPLFWRFVCQTAEGNLNRQLSAWNRAKQARTPQVSPEPPIGLVVVDSPNGTMSSYWDKVGFNFLAAQHQSVWDFSPDPLSRQNLVDVLAGAANAQVQAQINPLIIMGPGKLYGAMDYIAGLAKDGIKRGHWSETQRPQ
jgi:hypothetical protein